MANKDIRGHWGPRTSSNDFCEENYAVSQYIAEFWNTLSSLFIVFYGLFEIVKALQYGYHKRFLVCGLGLTLVGVGSAAFHSTLTREGQMLDELPMIYGSLIFTYIVMELDSRGVRGSKAWAIPWLLVFALVFTVLYWMFPDFFGFFVATYVLLTLWQLIKAYLFALRPRAHKVTKAMAFLSIKLEVFVFLCLWLPEHFLCKYIGWIHPHAIFHVLSGFAVHAFVIFMTFQQYHYEFRDAANAQSSSISEGDDYVTVTLPKEEKASMRLKYWSFMPYVSLEDLDAVFKKIA